MKRKIERGYIRVREKSNFWVVELFKLSPTEIKLISQWVTYVWENLNDQYAEIRIYSLKDNGFNIMTFREFLYNI